MSKNHYSTLGVDKTASQKEIKDSYRRLASKHHPDKGGDEATFKKIQEAYEVIGDETKRAEYDNENSPFKKYNFTSFDDFFNTMDFRQAQTTRTYQSFITLEEAYAGVTLNTQLGPIAVPRGVRNDTKMLVNNSTIVSICIRPHDRFIRDLDNLVLKAEISSLEAITGIDIEISHLDGSIIKTRVPSGFRNGKSMRLQGKGMPNPATGVFGDLYIVVSIDTPNDLTEEDKSAILAIVKRKSASI